MTRLCTLLVVVLALSGPTFAQSAMPVMPIQKNGSCPSGYSAQANTCVPRSGAKPAVHKNGSCPSGWPPQGNYCVARTANPKMVIPKNGSCPSGWPSQGNYCVAR